MAESTLATPVTLFAKSDVEIEPGLVLRAGSYPGVQKQTGISTIGGMNWTTPEYQLALTANQLANLGVQGTRLSAVNIDVTKFVRAGALSVEPRKP